MIIGFGSTEQDFEASEEQAIRDYVTERFAEQDHSYFTDEFVEEVRGWLSDRAKAGQDQAAVYKTAESHPDRYSYYWPWIIADASYIVVKLSVHHINRRHAFSPDGWALLQTKPLFLIEALDLRCAQEIAA